MAVSFQIDNEGVNWAQVAELLRFYGLTHLPGEKIREAFQNSYAVVFVKDEAGNTVGCGRAISDGVMQGAVFNIALAEEYHHQGLGRALMKRLTDQLRGMVITLYTHPKTLGWYQELGFSRMNTGLVRFKDEELDRMREAGFIDDFVRDGGIFAQ